MFPWPGVPRSKDLLDRAFGRASKASIRRGRTPLERARNLAALQIRTAANTLEGRLREIVRGVPNLDRIPPFTKELIDALVGIDRLRSHLGALEWAADQVRRVAGSSLRPLGTASPQEARRLRREAFGRMASLIDQVEDDLAALAKSRAALRALPQIDPAVPTIVVAGSPNVGKSAFVRAVSSGRPKVASYPFTTQDLSVGHFDRGYRRFQVVDTPGLLDRAAERRNAAERQAVAALRHVAHVVVFLLDPSETCGTPLAEQERLLERIAAEFSGTPFLVVENKADLMRSSRPRLKVSSLTGRGIRKALDAAVRKVTSRVPAAEPRLGSR